MNLTLFLGAACAVLAPTVIFLAVALILQLGSQSVRLVAMEQQLSGIGRRLEEPASDALADAVIDSSPKASELDIFQAKVSLASWELRDLIEAVAIAGPHYTRDGILSKSRHAFDLINQYRLERGFGAEREPRVGSRPRPGSVIAK